MDESQQIEKKQKQNTSAPRGGAQKKHVTFTFEQRLRAVKLHLEEGFSQVLVAEQLGISSAAVYKWTHKYKLYGEEALKSQSSGQRTPRVPEPVRRKIL